MVTNKKIWFKRFVMTILFIIALLTTIMHVTGVKAAEHDLLNGENIGVNIHEHSLKEAVG